MDALIRARALEAEIESMATAAVVLKQQAGRVTTSAVFQMASALTDRAIVIRQRLHALIVQLEADACTWRS